jgi:hypothetical protein
MIATTATATSVPASAGSETGTFDVILRGFRAATMKYAAQIEGGDYAVTGQIAPSGIFGAIADVSYKATSKGRQRGKGYLPFSFEEERRAPKGVSTATMQFQGGVPQVKKYNPPRSADPHAVNPRSQKGTVDPMTVIFASLRDQPRRKACALSLSVFDGKRRSKVTLSGPTTEDGNGKFNCSGEYRRIRGWSAEDMAERSRFPFQMTYQRQQNGLYRVVEITTPTTLGRATLRRR